MEKNERVRNLLKAMHFEGPAWIPAVVSIMPATWMRYGEAVEAILLEHPRLFPGYRPGALRDRPLTRHFRKGRWVDVWGVAWDNIADGLASMPVEDEAPLRDWSAFDSYVPPDPEKTDDLFGSPVDWAERARRFAQATASGGLAGGGLSHGFLFMRLFYLRGFTNFMVDVATRDPRLDRLVAMVRDYNLRLVDLFLDAGVEAMYGGDDLGMQTGLPISPADWRRLLKPCYAEILGRCRDRGVSFRFHSDGHMLDVIPDLVECGATAINPQVRANTLEGLRRVAQGKVCIDLDLDRQLFPFATPEQIRAHIHEAVATLNAPEGGLLLHAECEPDVPLENIRAICRALEEVGAGPR